MKQNRSSLENMHLNLKDVLSDRLHIKRIYRVVAMTKEKALAKAREIAVQNLPHMLRGTARETELVEAITQALLDQPQGSSVSDAEIEKAVNEYDREGDPNRRGGFRDGYRAALSKDSAKREGL